MYIPTIKKKTYILFLNGKVVIVKILFYTILFQHNFICSQSVPNLLLGETHCEQTQLIFATNFTFLCKNS